ncbi:MAG: hypothetical protein KKF01_09125, partial [Proteobacteria bacterium]|nr:hypothetical protein [Pseudomonadota bacterium]
NEGRDRHEIIPSKLLFVENIISYKESIVKRKIFRENICDPLSPFPSGDPVRPETAALRRDGCLRPQIPNLTML